MLCCPTQARGHDAGIARQMTPFDHGPLDHALDAAHAGPAQSDSMPHIGEAKVGARHSMAQHSIGAARTLCCALKAKVAARFARAAPVYGAVGDRASLEP